MCVRILTVTQHGIKQELEILAAMLGYLQDVPSPV
jgi:hypothetical protein